jgi:hypothetical protein
MFREDTLVDRVSSELGYYYRLSEWSVSYNDSGLRLGSGMDPSVNVIIKSKKPATDPLLLRVETNNTLQYDGVRERWKKLDLYLSHWYLVLPETVAERTFTYFMHHHITYCTIIQWKQLGNQILFEWLPGIFKRPSTPDLLFTNYSALDSLSNHHEKKNSGQLELY